MKKVMIIFFLAFNVLTSMNEAHAQDVYAFSLGAGIDVYVQDETIQPDGSNGITCMTKWVVKEDIKTMDIRKGTVDIVKYCFYDYEGNGQYQYIAYEKTSGHGGSSRLKPVETDYKAQKILDVVLSIKQ